MKTRVGVPRYVAVSLPFLLLAAVTCLVWHLRDAPSQSAERSVWNDVWGMYHKGNVAEGRKKGMELVKKRLADLKEAVNKADELEKELKKADDLKNGNLRKSIAEELKITRGIMLPNGPAIVSDRASALVELECNMFGSRQDEESRKFVDELVEIIEEANSIADELQKQAYDEIRPEVIQESISSCLYYRERAIVHQIEMSDSKRAEELFAKHEEFLSSRGIAKKDVIKGEKTAQEKEADKMLAMAKEDEAEIRESLVQFYDALTNSDEDKLRQLLVKEQTPDEIINSPKRKREQEKLGFDSFTMQMDKQSTIRFVRYEDGHVLVSVEDVLITLTTDGVSRPHRKSHLIRLKREDKEWRIWFPY